MQGGKGRRCSGVLAHPLPLGHGLEGAWGGGERPPPGTPGLLGFSRVQDGPLDFMGHDRDLGLGRVRTRWWWGGQAGGAALVGSLQGPWALGDSVFTAWGRLALAARLSQGAVVRHISMPQVSRSCTALPPVPRSSLAGFFLPAPSSSSGTSTAAFSSSPFCCLHGGLRSSFDSGFLSYSPHSSHTPPPPHILPASQNSPIDALSTMDGTRWLVHWRERDRAWDIVTRCLFLHQGWSKVHPPPPTRQHLPG